MIKLQFHWPILGHKNIIDYLKHCLETGKLAHAYLFWGPEHIGRTTVVENFVLSLFCEGSEKKDRLIPCQQCVYCQQIKQRTHADVYWLEKEFDKKTGKMKKNITIDQIRNLQNRLSLHSFLNSYKVAVILEAESLNKEAFNSLLKTLEEPTPQTIIFLLTSDIQIIPKTIISRCQVIKFLPVSFKEISDYLISQGLPLKKAKIFASLANGRPGIAVNFYQEPELFEEYKQKVKQCLDLFSLDINQKFETVEDIIGQLGYDFLEMINYLQNILNIWMGVIRDLLLTKFSLDGLLNNNFAQKELSEIASIYEEKKLIDLLKQIREAKKFLLANVNPKLVLENLVLNF